MGHSKNVSCFFLWELLYHLHMELNFIISPIQKLIVVNSKRQMESKNKRRLDGSLGKLEYM